MATPSLMVTQTRGALPAKIDGDDGDDDHVGIRRAHSSADIEGSEHMTSDDQDPPKVQSYDDSTDTQHSGKAQEFIGKVDSDLKGLKLAVLYCYKTRKILIMHAWPRQDDAKTEISLQNVRVIRKHTDKKPGLEIIAGETGDKYYIYVKPEAELNKWYDLLRKERVKAVGAEEQRLSELPAYMRNRARQNSTTDKSPGRKSVSDMLTGLIPRPRSRSRTTSISNDDQPAEH